MSNRKLRSAKKARFDAEGIARLTGRPLTSEEVKLNKKLLADATNEPEPMEEAADTDKAPPAKNNPEPMEEDTQEDTDQSAEARNNQDDPYSDLSELNYVYAGNLFEALRDSVDVKLSDNVFIDNRNLLTHISDQCDPHKDAKWKFLWRRKELLTDEEKDLRKRFFDEVVLPQLKITKKEEKLQS